MIHQLKNHFKGISSGFIVSSLAGSVRGGYKQIASLTVENGEKEKRRAASRSPVELKCLRPSRVCARIMNLIKKSRTRTGGISVPPATRSIRVSLTRKLVIELADPKLNPNPG